MHTQGLSQETVHFREDLLIVAKGAMGSQVNRQLIFAEQLTGLTGLTDGVGQHPAKGFPFFANHLSPPGSSFLAASSFATDCSPSRE
jgi:hypothetical protein